MKINATILVFLAGAILALPSTTHANDLPFIYTTTCNVVEVVTFSNRVHFKCSNTVHPIYFAVPTSSSAEATRLVTMASTALMGGGKIEVTYDYVDATPVSYGCMYSDCRRPIKLRLFKE